MKTQCPKCKAKFNVNEKNVGKTAKCPHCEQSFTIEPFVMTPLATPAATPVKTASAVVVPPAEAPAKAVQPPAESPVKIAEPVHPIRELDKKTEGVKKPEAVSDVVKTAEDVKGKPQSKGLSKTVYVYCWAGVQIIAGVCALLGLMLVMKGGNSSTLIAAAFATAEVFLICSVLIQLALFYKMWGSLQGGEASITPAKAVGFLFIPVFNIYWVLCMITGFAEDYNSFILRRSARGKNLPFALFTAYAFVFLLYAVVVATPVICVFAFLGLISRAFASYPTQSWALLFFVLVVGAAHFITYILLAAKTCDAVSALPSASAKNS